MLRALTSLSLVLLLLFPATANCRAAARLSVVKLKKLHLETALVGGGRPRAVIVAPVDGRYKEEIERLQARVAALCGVRLPVYGDDALPDELLKGKNVIAFGNMATNVFIANLYRRWQVILDLTYPGPGGYCVRSLHDPLGTGKNVIFIGGSDREGVKEATGVFLKELKGDRSLSVGRLMSIRLGKDVELPQISPHEKQWRVYSWRDSWRKNNPMAYRPSSYFGWNPISVAGCLYYMTGRREYLDVFKELALPRPEKVPLANRGDDAFTDPGNPLVKSDHYRAHLLDVIYDLIEESPQLNDNERLAITNRLMEHQYELDPNHSYSVAHGDRHALWHMMSIYTGSRYFATYYPDRVWSARLENVRKGFRSVLDDPSWGTVDTLPWVSTYLEPVFEFFLLDGPREFVESGTARSLMRALEILMTGEDVDYFSNSISLALLNQAAYLLNDGGYLWTARRLGFDLEAFRIGQSYWPGEGVAIEPPSRLVREIAVFPLGGADRSKARNTPAGEEPFQILSYRSGLSKSDDYLLMDGFNGPGAHPYQLNTILKLRMFGGKSVLDGYGNDLFVWRNGTAGDPVPRAALLRDRFAGGGVAYLASEVPDISASRWQRHVLYLGDKAIVVDRIEARAEGDFDVSCFWELGGTLRSAGKPSRIAFSGQGVRISGSHGTLERVSDRELVQRHAAKLKKGEALSFANMFNRDSDFPLIGALGDGVYRVDGSEPALLIAGPATYSPASFKGEMLFLDRHRLFLSRATELVVDGVAVFGSDAPLTLCWDFEKRRILMGAPASGELHLTLNGRKVTVAAGENSIAGVIAAPALAVLPARAGSAPLVAGLPRLEKGRDKTFEPVWTLETQGKVTEIRGVPGSAPEAVWAVSSAKEGSRLTGISAGGSITGTLALDGQLTALHLADTRQRNRFAFLAGFADDTVRAYSADGSELWNFSAALDPAFRIGDRYEAPWFTDPAPPYRKRGVTAILAGDLWGDGREEIVVGRPCTVEFRSMDSALIGRVPVRWGDVSSLALLHATGGKPPVLVAGRHPADKAALTSIDARHNKLSDDAFSALPIGTSDLHAFNRRGVSRLIAADLDGKDGEEVVYLVQGHWNEIRAYAGDGKPLWVKHLGPGKGASFPAAPLLEAVDLDGDGTKEIVFCTANGWVCALDRKGEPLWQRRLVREVSALSVDGGGMVAVGGADGEVILLDGAGATVMRGRAGSAVTGLVLKGGALYAGTAAGKLHKYTPDVPRT